MTIKDFTVRKKLSTFVCIAALLVLDKVLDIGLDHDTRTQLVLAASAYLIGQGIADFGKEKKVDSETEK